MIEIGPMPLALRIQFYRRLAEKAARNAGNSKGSLRLAFMRLGQHWQALANAAEAQALFTIVDEAGELAPEIEYQETHIVVPPDPVPHFRLKQA